VSGSTRRGGFVCLAAERKGEHMNHQENVDRLCGGLSEIAYRFVPDRVERAQAEETAALAGVTGFSINWEWLAAELLVKLSRNVLDLAIEYGREHREAIEKAAEDAGDKREVSRKK